MFGSGDCVEPRQIIEHLDRGVDGVLVGRGVLRNPWILAQAADIAAGRPPQEVTAEARGLFLLEYIDLLMNERMREPAGFRHMPDKIDPGRPPVGERHDRWVINKIRALGSWYTKGLDNGSHLRTAINSTETLGELRRLIGAFFSENGSELLQIA